MTDEATDAERIVTLEYQMVYAQQILPEIPTGVHNVTFDVRRAIYGDLHMMLRGFVLTEQAGPAAKEVVVYGEANIPRWVPRWLCGRWTRDRTVTVTTTPMWSYPQATVNVPNLGRAVQFRMEPTVERADD